MSGFGFDPWGLGPFGIPGPLSMVGAFPITVRCVRVGLSREPRNRSLTSEGDALNPATWTVTRNDTSETFVIESIARRSRVIFDVFLRTPLASALVEHTISAPTLLDVAGALIVLPYSADFQGTIVAAETNRDPSVTRDVANVQVPNSETAGGTYAFEANGDIATEAGADLVLKLVIRRLTTRRGEFRHLPDYGLLPPEKEPIRPSDLRMLQPEAERQCLLEPEVTSASVQLEMDASGVLFGVVALVLRTGARVSTPQPVQLTF